MDDLRFKDLTKTFDDGTTALESFSLDIPSPNLVVLVGPSGCGKTTLLRLIAGLEKPTSGEIFFGDQRLDVLPPQERDVAMVFQNYALYPHMTVRENLSFGLRVRRFDKAIIDERVRSVADSLNIDTLLDRKPGQLSGGQRQRVALGRAVIREPRVFLYDEPLSNLDARLRDEMRYLIRRLYERLQTTSIYVTHDQVEAMTIGDMLVVMKDGRIHQVGTPAQCYDRPADAFVASFLGSPPMNFLAATFSASAASLTVSEREFTVPGVVAQALIQSGESDITLGVRPEHLAPISDGGSRAVAVEGTVAVAETLGHTTLTHVTTASGDVILRGAAVARQPGEALTIGADLARVHFFSRRTGERIATDPAPIQES